jgi:hypothetical protein
MDGVGSGEFQADTGEKVNRDTFSTLVSPHVIPLIRCGFNAYQIINY